jgi:hypothetical protein
MKQIYTLLTGALILAGQFLYAQQTIQSIPVGGAWGSPSTWVGSVVPTAADNVVINGTVTVPVGIVCNDLTINGTLVDNASECSGVGTRHIVVNGDLVNNGSILLQGQYYCGGTKLELHGNIENNGTWMPYQVFFAGSADQFISASANAYLENSDRFYNEKTGGEIKVMSDIYLKCPIDLGQISVLDMQGHDLMLHGNGKVINASLTGASGIHFLAGAYLGTWGQPLSISGSEIQLHGKAQIGIIGYGDPLIVNGNLTVIDTLIDNGTECSSADARHLRVNGSFTNQGKVLRLGQYYCGGLKLELRGDVLNNGPWEPYQAFFAGNTDQQISTSASAYFANSSGFYNEKTGGSIAAVSDIGLKCVMDLGQLTPLNMQGNDMILNGSGKFVNAEIVNAAGIRFEQDAFLGTWGQPLSISGSDIQLYGKARIGIIGYGDPLIVNGNLTVNDTLIDNGTECDNAAARHLRVNGTFTNEGKVLRLGQYYCGGLKLELHGNVYNNGPWEPYQVLMGGNTIQQLTSAGGNYFANSSEILSEKTGGEIVADGVLLLRCPLALNNLTPLNMQQNALHINGAGRVKTGEVNNLSHMYFESGASLGAANSQDQLVLNGDSIILHHRSAFDNYVTFNANVAVLDTMINIGGGAVTTVFNGNLNNLGTVINQTGAYMNFSQNVTGNVINNGSWSVVNLRLVGSAVRRLSAPYMTYSNITFSDTLNLVGNNAVPRLTPASGAQNPRVIVPAGASLELTDRVAPAELINRGKVLWSHDINCATTADYNFYEAQVRNRLGCSASLVTMETYGEQQAPGTINTIDRYWRIKNTPLTYEDTLQRIVLSYDDDILNGNTEADLKVFFSDNSGISWTRIENGVTVNTSSNTVTVTNAPTVGTYTLASQELGVTAVRPTLASIESNHGGKGSMTAFIYGSGFTANALPRLEGDVVITPEDVQLGSFGEVLSVTFDLTDHPEGSYDVVVEIPGDTVMTLTSAFTLEPRIDPAPFVHLSGREDVMIGRWQTYTITYGNTSNIDARAVPIYISMTDVAGLEVEFVDFTVDITEYAIQQGHQADLEAMPIYFEADTAFNDVDGVRVYPLYIPRIPANSVNSVRLRIKSLEPLMLQVAIQDPLFVNPFDPACVIGVIGEGVIDISTSAIPGVGCIWSIGKNAFKTADSYTTSGTKSWGSWLYDWTVTAVDCGINLSGAGAFAKATGVLFANFYGYYSAFDECRPKPIRRRNIRQFMSLDPNAKLGPTGYAQANYIAYPDEVPYVIYFENLETATAPAQTVTITDTLNLSVFDVSSFRFGPVEFGDQSVTFSVGSASSFERFIDMRPSKDIILHIIGEMDTLTGIITWDFTSIDPLTGELTEDPFGGFLPPNVLSPEGEGSVSFFIKLKTGLANNTLVANKASVVFDVNAPIVTDTWSNRLDLVAPASAISTHTMVNTTTLDIHWAGTDQASGIRDYTLHVSEDGGEYLAISFGSGETSTTFIGEIGSTYRFYTTATDSVGNVEAAPSLPDLTVTLEPDGVEDLAADFSFSAYPNPVTNGMLTIETTGSTCFGTLTIDVVGLDGRTLMSSQIPMAERSRVNLSKLAAGTYLLRLSNGEHRALRKVVVQH